MLTHVEFRSDDFPPYKDEEKLINPGLWGKRLADFLCSKLRGEGFEIGEPLPEDWGWVIPVSNKKFKLWIGCGNYQEYPDGFLCFIEPHRPSVRWFPKKTNIEVIVGSLQRALDKILTEHTGIRHKRWWTKNDFNSRTVQAKLS